MPPRPYTIHVSDAVLDDLRQRLERTRWPEQLDGVGWDYGSSVAYARELCDYWRTEYDWREQEARLNRLPQFLCEVDGVDLHFWRVRGAGGKGLPLLLLHGWPSSNCEFLELIEPLAAEGFDVVVPALPGFGFGGRPRERGWGVSRIAAAFDALMSRELGYERYGVHGGDWGSFVAARLGFAYPDHVAGIHVTMVIPFLPDEVADEDRAELERQRAWRAEESAYREIQSTKPDSLTVGHTDSPAGLAAWVVEKFRTWSDCDGDVERAFTKDTLLTNIMFYWAPGSVASAARIYYESRRDASGFFFPRIEVPCAVAAFPREPFMMRRHWIEHRYTIARWTEMPRGGHFPALEEPQLLLADVTAFFSGLNAS